MRHGNSNKQTKHLTPSKVRTQGINSLSSKLVNKNKVNITVLQILQSIIQQIRTVFYGSILLRRNNFLRMSPFATS